MQKLLLTTFFLFFTSVFSYAQQFYLFEDGNCYSYTFDPSGIINNKTSFVDFSGVQLFWNGSYWEINGPNIYINYTQSDPPTDGIWEFIGGLDPNCEPLIVPTLVEFTLSIDENIFNKISFHQNFNGEALNFNFGNLKGIKLKVYNSIGQLLFSSSIINSSKYQLKLDVPSNIYFVEIDYQNLKKTHKFLM